jgi:hypothetical protein
MKIYIVMISSVPILGGRGRLYKDAFSVETI